MGILAALQVDGAISFYSVPHPSALQSAASHSEGPIHCKSHRNTRCSGKGVRS